MRRLIAFRCTGDTLLGTLDGAPGRTGLLIVSGGNEIRIGAHRGMALLAQRIAEAGHPVFRFDRRGIGDSTGENRGFESSAEDIAAAAAAFRAEAGVARFVGDWKCDAATAHGFVHPPARKDALVLANPWAIEPTDDLPPAAAIRARYAAKLRDPREWLRLIRGGVDIRKLLKGLSKISTTKPELSNLATRLAAALADTQIPATILLASGDNTAIAFADAVDTTGIGAQVERLDSASHSFASQPDRDWLFERVLQAL